jgi:protein phosphatase 1 regulatory subunit 7
MESKPQEEEKKELPKIPVVVQPTKNEDSDEENKEDEPIKYTYMGSEVCPIDPESEDICFNTSFRIPKIEGLEKCHNLLTLGLRKNLITKIEGLDACNKMEELELYDNRIKVIENISHLTNLVVVDLNFNNIKII